MNEPAVALGLLLVSLLLLVGARLVRRTREQFFMKQWPLAVVLFFYHVGLPYVTLLWGILQPETLGLSGIDHFIFIDWSRLTLGLQLQQATTLMLLTWLLDSPTTIITGLLALALLIGLRWHLTRHGVAFPTSSGQQLLTVIYEGLHWAFYRAILWQVSGDLYLGVVLGIGAVLLEESLAGLVGSAGRSRKPQFYLTSIILILTATIFFYSPNLWLLWPVHLGMRYLLQANQRLEIGRLEIKVP